MMDGHAVLAVFLAAWIVLLIIKQIRCLLWIPQTNLKNDLTVEEIENILEGYIQNEDTDAKNE